MLDDLNFLKNKQANIFFQKYNLLINLIKDFFNNKISEIDFENCCILAPSLKSQIAVNLWYETFIFKKPVFWHFKRYIPAWVSQKTVVLIIDEDFDENHLNNIQEAKKVFVLTSSTNLKNMGQKQIQQFEDKKKISLEFFLQPELKELNFYFIYCALLKFGLEQKLIQPVEFSYNALIETLEKTMIGFDFQKSAKDNLAKQLAYEIIGKTPIVYTSNQWLSLAAKWRFDFQTITQQLLWVGQWSENNWTDFKAWQRQVFDKNYLLLCLVGSQLINLKDLNLLKQKVKSLSGQMPQPIFISSLGQTNWQQGLYLCLLAEFTAYYVDLLNQ